MKKIGMLILILVIAMATVGIAYARWTDTVAINATVGTGEVKLGILDAGTNDPLGSPDPQCGDAQNTEKKDVASAISTNGEPKCKIVETQYYDSIKEVFDHVYPWYAPSTTVVIANCGTIPVKIWKFDYKEVDPDGILKFVTLSWVITDENGVPHPGSGTLQDLAKALSGMQIGAGKTIIIDKKICFNEEIKDGDLVLVLPQGKSATIDITIYATQWNEYP